MTLLYALVLCLDVAVAAPDPGAQSPPAESRKDRRRARKTPAEVLPPPTEDVEEPVVDGIFEWVESMEGEIPSEEQVDAVRETEAARHDEAAAEASLLAGSTHPLYLDLVDPAEFDIPVATTPEVEKWVAYFTGPGRAYYARWLGRSTRFRPMMIRELEAAGLPKDLVYLSMIESGYNPHAWSTAAAAGLWQFISSTARIYDLRVDYWVDDRRDPEASLHAAIAFLSELHKMFGKWELAWAAYNGGPGRVRRAVDGAGSNDFWVLARGAWLHAETDNYVPKIMAAAIIGHHPERYGFVDLTFQPELVYETRAVEGGVPLDVIAQAAGLPLEDLKTLNPALKRFVTPPEGYALRVPPGAGDGLVAALAALPPEVKVAHTVRYKVRSGDTLSRIATKYGVSVSELMHANGLKSANRILVGTVLEVPSKEGAPAERAPEVASLAAPPPSPPPAKAAPRSTSRTTRHTVRSGDTLSEVAGRYDVTVDQLKQWNDLPTSTIQIGQSLRVVAPAEAPAPSTSRTPSSRHTVRRGETLSGIADAHDVRLADLMRWNKIRDASDIEAGRVLVVNGPEATSSTTTVTVRAGDTLWEIATRNGVTVAQLQQWNGLRGSSIQAGQKLEIRR